MFQTLFHDQHVTRRVWQQFAVVILIIAATYYIGGKLQLSEHYLAWTHRFTFATEADELPLALLAGAIALYWFVRQRVKEAQTLIARNHALLQRILDVQESERRAVAQNLHDDLGQYLNAIKVQARTLQITTQVDTETMLIAERIAQNADHAFQAARQLMRSLRPTALDELGIAAALEHLTEHWRNTTDGKISYQLNMSNQLDFLPDNASIALFRIVQEALTNVYRHAHASAVNIALERDGQAVALTITDNGIGFKPQESNLHGYGLLGMAERVEALKGSLEIMSGYAKGTEIRVRFHLPEETLCVSP